MLNKPRYIYNIRPVRQLCQYFELLSGFSALNLYCQSVAIFKHHLCLALSGRGCFFLGLYE